MSETRDTAYQYGRDYQLAQAAKYRERDSNHWKHRINLAHRLIEEYSLPRLGECPRSEVVTVDVGCSIGTFALEMARRGYRSFGVDSDHSALEIAAELAEEEGLDPMFVCEDVAEWGASYPPIDIAVCFDIFEHLHDDELGAFLQSIRRQLSRRGSLVYHTFPSELEHIFFGHTIVVLPLAPLFWLPREAFRRTAKAYSDLVDIALVLLGGRTMKERLHGSCHCNPLSAERLGDMLTRAGYEVVEQGTGQLNPLKPWVRRLFARHPISHRNIWGVAIPKDGAA